MQRSVGLASLPVFADREVQVLLNSCIDSGGSFGRGDRGVTAREVEQSGWVVGQIRRARSLFFDSLKVVQANTVLHTEATAVQAADIA